jgi:hypothetical protein
MKKDILDLRVEKLQREAIVFRFSQRFKNVPFINVSYEYYLPKDKITVSKIFVLFELPKWADKIVNNPITGLKSIEYTKYTKNNTIKVAMLY